MTELDKYEYNLKLEEIDKLVDQGDYEEAASLADTIDWRRVRNVRTLCLISEIYEASGRLEDSKKLLVRAYRKSPMGRTVLYRLVEVTTALKQYDEALEYYTEYVQAAPHDNNRYILKYMIYRGRGSSVEELIAILEEYLGQEYTEKWAYELAKLYQQAGQMQKCFAACDDLVLWFHSGKYVLKALELKRRYTSLTPKQQQIYDDCLQEEAQQDYLDEPEEDNIIRNVESTDGEVIAESIMAETEKSIAGEIAARKAELDKEAARLDALNGLQQTDDSAVSLGDTKPINKEAVSAAVSSPAGQDDQTAEPVQEAAETDDRDLKVELAKSMRKIISGVVKRTEENEDDIPAVVESKIQNIQKLTVPEPEEQAAAQLSIDDILLSMGEKGKKIAAEAMQAQKMAEAERQAAAEREAAKQLSAEQQEAPVSPQEEETEEEQDVENRSLRSVTAAAADELTEMQREALRYTNNPEKLLRNKSALPTYSEEDDLGKTRRIFNTKEELMEAARKEILAEKTIRIPTEEISRRVHAAAPEEDSYSEDDILPEEAARVPEKEMADGSSGMSEDETIELPGSGESAGAWEDGTAGDKEIELPGSDEAAGTREDGTAGDEEIELPGSGESAGAWESGTAGDEEIELPGSDESAGTWEDEQPEDDGSGLPESDRDDEASEQPEDGVYEDEYEEDEYLKIPQHLRKLFSGFTEIESLEDQIANAIIQAESKGDDRTSRSGNILIFGAHGSGKTTLAMNLAKAIAQDKGNQVMKMAKIYAADLNRKDIAATIAKIAGGTLIIEEAGDLEPNTVEQLTTAMEFRTDGLIIILEDEQQYIHELLMRHPRFTMKFTAQIYIPVYTAEELAMFGQIYANAQDYVIGEEGLEALYEKISAASASGTEVAIGDVIAMVSKAIQNSNKFFRKMSMGKKRYDENDYIILFAKDFR